LNAKCHLNSECSSKEFGKHGELEDVGILNCIESNFINDPEQEELGLAMIENFYKNDSPTLKE